MNITIFGATGKVGSRVIAEAVSRGHAVIEKGVEPKYHEYSVRPLFLMTCERRRIQIMRPASASCVVTTEPAD
jgi:nucleoside-diphosphate-sugar epimerase